MRSRPGSYIVKDGNIDDFERLELLFEAIGAQEQDILSAREEEKKKFNQKRRKFKDSNVESAEEMAEKEEAATLAYQAALASGTYQY